jgi:hypothetical protein
MRHLRLLSLNEDKSELATAGHVPSKSLNEFNFLDR